MAYTTLNFDYHIELDWGIVRGLIAGLVWAGVVVTSLAVWRRMARTQNEALLVISAASHP